MRQFLQHAHQYVDIFIFVAKRTHPYKCTLSSITNLNSLLAFENKEYIDVSYEIIAEMQLKRIMFERDEADKEKKNLEKDMAKANFRHG
jgi:hypothetical protein